MEAGVPGKLLILGANNPHVLRVFRACSQADPSLELKGFIDNDPAKRGKEFCGFTIFGGHEVLSEPEFAEVSLLNCITRDARTRRLTCDELARYDLPFANLVHPGVSLDAVSCGGGLYILENVVVEAGVELSDHVSIHSGTIIGHETRIGRASFVAHGCAISGCVEIGSEVFVGAGAIVQPRLSIGEGAVIGSGAVVVKNVKPYDVVFGNPARRINTREK